MAQVIHHPPEGESITAHHGSACECRPTKVLAQTTTGGSGRRHQGYKTIEHYYHHALTTKEEK